MRSTTAICISTVLALNMINLPYASATNTITFNGSITDATCDVSLEYKGIKVGDAGTGSITLDEVSKTALSGVGSSAGGSLSLSWHQIVRWVRRQNPKLQPILKAFMTITKVISIT